jgi:DNA-binding response OmpR family regulator
MPKFNLSYEEIGPHTITSNYHSILFLDGSHAINYPAYIPGEISSDSSCNEKKHICNISDPPQNCSLMKELLIIQDDEAVGKALKNDFENERYVVKQVTDGNAGLEISRDHEFDMILIDFTNHELDGIEMCKTLRRNGVQTPVIIISSKSREIDKVLGLEIGADDYVTKPYSSRKLQARVKAVLRRVQKTNLKKGNSIFVFGNISVDMHGFNILKNGVHIKLTAREFSILCLFIKNRLKVVTRDEILDQV